MTVIKLLMKPQYLKVAIKLIKDYNFDVEQFPMIINTLVGVSSNHYISRVFRPEGHPDHMALYKVEDLFTDRPRFQIKLVEALIKKEMYQEATEIWTKNKLQDSDQTPEQLKETFESIEFVHKERSHPVDVFGPRQINALKLSEQVTITFIGSEAEIEKLADLVGSDMIGIDSEWRPPLTKFEV